ncbi:MAG: thiamine phosphate synthase [Actinomycetia bacterium]|nr:thiamine phosphate synthase [Actinomycetes bacterium]
MDVSGLHVLIDPARVPPSRLATFVPAIARAGARVVQIRIKEGSARAALAYGTEVLRWARPAGLLVVVDDRVDWALALGADGVHVGQEDMPVRDVRRIAPGLLVGASAGTSDELAAALADGPDYVGIGPVFRTGSKADAGDPLGPEGLHRLSAEAGPVPVVAIGGIRPDNAAAVWATGVAGIAVIAAVAEAADPASAVRALLHARNRA